MRFRSTIIAASLITSTLLLSACDSGPTTEEVQAMVEAEKKAVMDASGPAAALAKTLMPEVTINAVKNCSEIRDDVFRCDVETSTKAFGQKVEEVQSIEMTKNSKGSWTTVN